MESISDPMNTTGKVALMILCGARTRRAALANGGQLKTGAVTSTAAKVFQAGSMEVTRTDSTRKKRLKPGGKSGRCCGQ